MASKPSVRACMPPISKHRLDALSDGLFAIVMTLLVLELKVPELPRHVAAGELWRGIADSRYTLVSFTITFILAAAFWRQHALVLQFVRELRGKILALNLAFLMFVALLPFSTALLGRFMGNGAAQTLYFANQFAMGGLLFLQWRVAVHEGLVEEPPRGTQQVSARLVIIPPAAVVGAIVANVNPQMSFMAFIIVVIFTRILQRRLERAAK